MRHRSEHGLRATGISWAITLLFLGCSTPGIHQIQIDLDNIQQQLWKIQKENAALTEEVARVREAGVAPSGSVDTDAASLTLRFQELERDLERLQSHLDDTDQRLTAVVQDLRMTRDALQALVVTLPAGRPHVTICDAFSTFRSTIELSAMGATTPA